MLYCKYSSTHISILVCFLWYIPKIHFYIGYAASLGSTKVRDNLQDVPSYGSGSGEPQWCGWCIDEVGESWGEKCGWQEPSQRFCSASSALRCLISKSLQVAVIRFILCLQSRERDFTNWLLFGRGIWNGFQGDLVKFSQNTLFLLSGYRTDPVPLIQWRTFLFKSHLD